MTAEKEGKGLDIKEFLSRGYMIEREMKELEAEKKKAFTMCTVHGAAGDIKVQSSPRNSVDERLADYADYSAEIDKALRQLIHAKREIFNVIRGVKNNTYRYILEMRYIRFQTWESIAETSGYAIRHVHRLHKRALAAAAAVLDTSEN